jgi:hypothetical protein
MKNNVMSALRSIVILSGGIVILLMEGCATIFTGTTDVIKFSSNVDPVRVFIGGRLVGTTPLTADVRREIGKGPIVRFEKEGYETQEFPLEKEFNWVSVPDVTSVITSGGIDVLTGAIMEYSPRQYHIEMLTNKQTSINESQHQITFAKFVLLNADWIRVDLANDGGEYSNALASLVIAERSTPSEFKSWLQSHKDSLVSASDPEMLLTELRQSNMTP